MLDDIKSKVDEEQWPLPIQVKILKVMGEFVGNNGKDIKALKYLREIEFEYFI